MRHAPRPRVRSAVPRTFGHGCAFCAERALPSGFSARRDLSSGILADHRNFVQQLAQDFASRRGALKTSGLGSLSRPSTARTARTACSQNRKPASADEEISSTRSPANGSTSVMPPTLAANKSPRSCIMTRILLRFFTNRPRLHRITLLLVNHIGVRSAGSSAGRFVICSSVLSKGGHFGPDGGINFT